MFDQTPGKLLWMGIYIFFLMGRAFPAPTAPHLGTLLHPQEIGAIPFYVTQVTCDADVPFDHSEFFYLTHVASGSMCSVDAIQQARVNLERIQRFNQIEIYLDRKSHGTAITFILHSHWILQSIDIVGVWWGKHEIQNLYFQRIGDVFDAPEHERSLQHIRRELKNSGYWSSIVRDELIYNRQNKMITVRLHIKRGKKYHVRGIHLLVQCTDPAASHTIQQRIEPLLKRVLARKTYTKKRTEHYVGLIRSLLRKHGYLGHQLEVKPVPIAGKTALILQISITLGIKRDVSFEGNAAFSSGYLRQKLLGDDYPEWLMVPELISELIMHEYLQHGFFDITIEHIVNSKNHLHFKISEGERYLLGSYVIREIDDLIPPKDFTKQEIDPTRPPYEEATIEAKLLKLNQSHLTEGFWDFKIIDKQIVPHKDQHTVDVKIIISKGQRRLMGSFHLPKFEHLHQLPCIARQAYDHMLHPKPFDPAILTEQSQAILQYLHDRGFWFATVEPELIKVPVDDATILVHVIWRINPGKRVRFGKTYLQGITRLPFSLLKRTIMCKEGSTWNRAEIDLTRRRLRKLGIFKQIYLQPLKVAHKSPIKPIVLRLVDDDMFELRLRAGYFLTSKNFIFKRQSTYKFGSSLIIKNPLRCADKLMFNADVTNFERNFNADYQVPYLFGWDLLGRVRCYAHQYDHPIDTGSGKSAYKATQDGFMVGWENEFRPGYTWGVNVGNEWMATRDIRGNLNIDPAIVNKRLPYFFLEPNLIIEHLDDKLCTKKGFFTFLSIKMSCPEKLGIITYKFIAEQSFFWPVYRDIVLGCRLRFGHILGQDFSLIMPIERFYLGGPNSLRGYEKDAVPPLGICIIPLAPGITRREYTIQGGSSAMSANFELRFPIYHNVGGVLFQDVGVLSQSGLSGFTSRWYPTSGFGFRYQTPVGALRFDIGWKWRRTYPEERMYAWYLTLGQAF